jgi:hypothetical protein
MVCLNTMELKKYHDFKQALTPYHARRVRCRGRVRHDEHGAPSTT